MTSFIHREAAPLQGDVLAVSSYVRSRNFLRATHLFGFAAAAALVVGLAILLSHGMDFSSLIPHTGLLELTPSPDVSSLNILQPNWGDLGSVQYEPWWAIPQSVRELWWAMYAAPPQVKTAAAFGVFLTALMVKKLLGGWRKGGSDGDRENRVD